ncbi:hypothetical protein QQF64_007982 [Cirrhinus molitorella]|uniref:Uncharacterized protein n=1 Tax=Cirrhinus molitorella TaxID=172907 RepID=A0ABR3M7Y0_9TELE
MLETNQQTAPFGGTLKCRSFPQPTAAAARWALPPWRELAGTRGVQIPRAGQRSRARHGGTYTKIGSIQRRLAWPLRKDDTQIREALHIFGSRYLRSSARWALAW